MALQRVYGCMDLSGVDLQCISRLHTDHAMASQWNDHQRSRFVMALNIEQLKLTLVQHQRFYLIDRLIPAWVKEEVFDTEEEEAEVRRFLWDTREAYGSFKLVKYFYDRMSQFKVIVPMRGRLQACGQLIKAARTKATPLSSDEIIQFYDKVFWVDMNKMKFDQHLKEFKQQLGLNDTSSKDDVNGVRGSVTDPSVTVPRKSTHSASSRKRRRLEESVEEEEKETKCDTTGPIPMELDEDDSSTTVSQQSRRPRLEPESTELESTGSVIPSNLAPSNSNAIMMNEVTTSEMTTNMTPPPTSTPIDIPLVDADGPMDIHISAKKPRLLAQPTAMDSLIHSSVTPAQPPITAPTVTSPSTLVNDHSLQGPTSPMSSTVTDTSSAAADPNMVTLATHPFPHLIQSNISGGDYFNPAKAAWPVINQHLQSMAKEFDLREKKRRALELENGQLKVENERFVAQLSQLQSSHQELMSQSSKDANFLLDRHSYRQGEASITR